MSIDARTTLASGHRVRPVLQRLVVPMALMAGDAASLAFGKCVLLPPLQSQILLYRGQGAGMHFSPTGVDPFWLLALICIGLSWVKGQYRKRRLIWEDGRELASVVFWLMVVHYALMLSIGQGMVAVWRVPAAWVAALGATLAVRAALKSGLYRAGLYREPTIIVGTGGNARQTALTVRQHRSLGYELRAFVHTGSEPVEAETAAAGVPVIAAPGDLGELVVGLGYPHVIVALEAEQQDHLQEVIDHLAFRTSIQVVPAIRGLPLYGMEMSHVFGRELLMLRVRNNLARPHLKMSKRALDLAAAGFLLVLLAPLLVVLAVLVGRDGPVVFRHQRVGRNGRPFGCLKFRTMVVDAQAALEGYLAAHPEAREEWEQTRKIKNDPRITAVGHFLRRTSLDELPQLFNVLAGDMSLVGPRPVVHDELAYYGSQVGYYCAVRPGITGLWQVSGRNDVDYGFRVFLDAWYVKNWSLWYDIVILLRTAVVVFSRRGAY